jgi:hypothetical protein
MAEDTPNSQPAAATKPRLEHSEASKQITEGASDCKDCGNPPLGIVQPRHIAGIGATEIYEVGCIVCRDHRALAPTREEAVRKWNAREFLAPPPAQPESAPAAD